MKNALSILAAISMFGASAVASAEQDDEWVDESSDLTPTPPAPAPAPAKAAPAAATTTTRTDHDQTIGAWGFQIADAPTFEAAFPPGAAPPLNMLGVRKWGTRDSGWEAGALFGFTQFGAEPEPTFTIIGGTFGYLKAMGVYKHIVVFWEPQGSVVAAVANDGDDDTNDPTMMLLSGNLNVGAEVRLGMIGIPTVGITAKLSAGLTISNNGDESDFFIGTKGGVGNSVRGILRSNIGFVFYIP